MSKKKVEVEEPQEAKGNFGDRVIPSVTPEHIWDNNPHHPDSGTSAK